jgi:nitrite reductase/ring-hydroxylating ferredoxin subunit
MADPVVTSMRLATSALPLRVEGASGPIALFQVGATVHAIEDACLRCGSTLVAGAQEGAVVTCRVCGWRYDVSSGCLIGLPALRLPTFRVRQSSACGTEGTR